MDRRRCQQNVTVTTYRECLEQEHGLSKRSSGISKHVVTQCIRARSIGPHNAVTLEQVRSSKQYAQCTIGNVFKVSFCLPKELCRLGHRLSQLPPSNDAPIHVACEGSSNVHVQSFCWHTASRKALCLRCHNVISSAAQIPPSHAQARAAQPCTCENPNDLLELYSNIYEPEEKVVWTEECSEDTNLTEIHMLLRIPRIRADGSHSKACYKELPVSTFGGVTYDLKPMVLRITAVPNDVNLPALTFTGFVRLCGKNAALCHRQQLCMRGEAELRRRFDKVDFCSHDACSGVSHMLSTSRCGKRPVVSSRQHKICKRRLSLPPSEHVHATCMDGSDTRASDKCQPKTLSFKDRISVPLRSSASHADHARSSDRLADIPRLLGQHERASAVAVAPLHVSTMYSSDEVHAATALLRVLRFGAMSDDQDHEKSHGAPKPVRIAQVRATVSDAHDPHGRLVPGHVFTTRGCTYYIARSGDTLARIGSIHGISEGELVQRNTAIAGRGPQAPLTQGTHVLLTQTCTLSTASK
eukprot:m.203055 g.203055  ORF g.203055 m.203055 type:complete len:526 (-) comp18843_c1_seq21:210-1787(-)